MNIVTGMIKKKSLDDYIIDNFSYYDGYNDVIDIDRLLNSFARLLNVLVDKDVLGETAVKGILNDPYGFDFEE